MSSVLDCDGGSAAHPLIELTDALEDLLDSAANTRAWSMTPSELQRLLPRLTRIRNRTAEVELRVLAQADRANVGDDVGATNTPAWWAHATGQRVPGAHGQAKLAARLDDCVASRRALASGRLNIDQTRAIVDAVDALPVHVVGPEIVADAECHLIGLGDLDGEVRLDPKRLRIAGRRILEVIAPDVAEQHEKDILDKEERHAAATASFSMRPDGLGSMHGRFKIPVLAGEILAKHLAAIAAPKHQRATANASTSDEKPSRAMRLGQAFVDYLETRAAAGTPKAGGVAATVVVTMTMESLLGAERAATLDTGERISASEARRLACEAGIIPAVLGGHSQVLDLGRKTRFHTEPQRIAMMLRDGGCAAEGCDWPPGMCHAHHLTPWSRGGKTSLDNGVLLCPRHHTLAHDARYLMTTGLNRKVVFARRT